MAVTIEAVVADIAPQGGAVRYVSRARQFTEQELALKPLDYPLVVEACIRILTVSAGALPVLRPGPGVLPAEALLTVLQRVLDEEVFDLRWEKRVIDRLVGRLEARRRRGMMALLREQGELPAEQAGSAVAEARALRAGLLDRRNLVIALDEMSNDGFITLAGSSEQPAYCLPGAETTPETPFHGDLVRQAINGHLAEVRQWNLPAPTPDRLLALAREHCRLLDGHSVRHNTMLAGAVRERLEQRLTATLQPDSPRGELVLRLLLEALHLPSLVEPGRTAEELLASIEPLVTEPDNIAAVLSDMVGRGELRYITDCSGTACFADPELALPEHLLVPAQAARTTPELPTDMPRASGSGSLKERLRTLRELLDEELITRDDFDRRKAELLAEL
ncbi:MAG: SHOCT domain-containing protein [Armatimonadetes bacterium]|nr:SHOCT domain-containing protein [Armatimonadota bacterium]